MSASTRPVPARGPLSRRVRLRLVVTALVAAASLWFIYPPREKVKLGLDLAGGVHLVLEVKTDQALQAHTRAAADELRTKLVDAGVDFDAVHLAGATEFQLEGVRDIPQFLHAASGVAPAFARHNRDGVHVFRMTPAASRALADDVVEQAVMTIERRVNALGVSEPVVARYTTHDRILVELPGVEDADRAKQIIASTLQLQLTLVERGPFPDRAAALQAYGNVLPPGLVLLAGPSDAGDGPARYYVLQETPVVSGGDLRDARESVDEYNRPAVAFALEEAAARRFGAFTERHINRVLATVLGGQVMSTATIVSRIDAHGQIVGLTRDEVAEQVIALRSGALPADLEYIEERTIGASLGVDAIRSGVLASLGGLVLVVMFMLTYYGAMGVNAAFAIVLNLLLLLALIALVPVTMTLPGIAGLILTIGMGVDSNVLIFERIKEELAAVPKVRSAVTAGFERAWLTIVDTHVTSLIAAAFLFQFGTSPIRGFATTLTMGLMANVFTSVFASRTLFDLALRYPAAAERLCRAARAPRHPKGRVDLTRRTTAAALLSLTIIGGGVVALATRGIPLGIDFSGGTLLVLQVDDRRVTEGSLRAAMAAVPGQSVVQRYGPAGEQRFLIRLPLGSGSDPERDVVRATQALRDADVSGFQVVGRELVDAAVGADLQRRGLYATAASVAAISVYIGARFRWAFAMGAMAATAHDVLVTLACLALAGYDLSLNVAAAMLTVIGYSVNDTIVIFDRVRENLIGSSAQSLDAVVSRSVQQTLSRTMVTAGTTLLAGLSLYVFGGEALQGFAFTLLVGIASGTWSTVFIAAPLAARLGMGTLPYRTPAA